MSTIQALAFLFFSLTLSSLWIQKEVKIWGILLGCTFFASIAGGLIQIIGAVILFTWMILWIVYVKNEKKPACFFFMAILILMSFIFKFHFFPGFQTIAITPKFKIGIDLPIMAFFPLVFLVPLASSRKDWEQVFFRGLPISLVGIALMAILAITSGTVHWQYKLPNFAAERYLSNFFLTAIPEEGFYRGFVQNELQRRLGKGWALFLASVIFTFAHLYWAPSLGVFLFVFLAGLLYGGVYILTGKIESAILCHFLLNFIHMTFFSYHAM